MSRNFWWYAHTDKGVKLRGCEVVWHYSCPLGILIQILMFLYYMKWAYLRLKISWMAVLGKLLRCHKEHWHDIFWSETFLVKKNLFPWSPPTQNIFNFAFEYAEIFEFEACSKYSVNMYKCLHFFLGLGENTHAEPRTLLIGFTHILRGRYVNLLKAAS
jgi:hypothetical protein